MRLYSYDVENPKEFFVIFTKPYNRDADFNYFSYKRRTIRKIFSFEHFRSIAFRANKMIISFARRIQFCTIYEHYSSTFHKYPVYIVFGTGCFVCAMCKLLLNNKYCRYIKTIMVFSLSVKRNIFCNFSDLHIVFRVTVKNYVLTKKLHFSRLRDVKMF